MSEAAGSWGAVQRHNGSQGKPSKRDGEGRKKNGKEPCRPNISRLHPGKIYPHGSVSSHRFMACKKHAWRFLFLSRLMWALQNRFGCFTHITNIKQREIHHLYLLILEALGREKNTLSIAILTQNPLILPCYCLNILIGNELCHSLLCSGCPAVL